MSSKLWARSGARPGPRRRATAGVGLRLAPTPLNADPARDSTTTELARQVHPAPTAAELAHQVLDQQCAGELDTGATSTSSDHKETSADLVDLTLLGNISDARRLTAKRTRDELYARLHEMHDANASAEAGDERELHCFNDCQFAPPFEDWPVRLATK